MLALGLGAALLLSATLTTEAWPAAGDGAADKAMAVIRPQSIQAEMRFLSDDLLEGRGTGTRGYEIAAKYMASQFEEIGIAPAGETGTYFQTVPFRQGQTVEPKTSLTLVTEKKRSWFFARITSLTRIRSGRRRPWKRRWCLWATV